LRESALRIVGYPDLCRQEHLLPPQAGRLKTFADFCFVPIDLARVDVPEACLQRRRDHAQHVWPRHAIGAKSERRNGGSACGNELHGTLANGKTV
jgi:hypothetical protein